MPRNIEPKEIRRYNVDFKSTLEADWASIFEHLELSWKYEREEPFKFSDGTKYTPDFWIEDLGVWVEIKPTLEIALEEDAIRKCSKLALEHDVFVDLEVGEASFWFIKVRHTQNPEVRIIPIYPQFIFSGYILRKSLGRELEGLKPPLRSKANQEKMEAKLFELKQKAAPVTRLLKN
jgi:hypothetical protein